MKALVKDRNQRYNSVLEFAQEFAQAAEAGSHPAAQSEPQTTVTSVAKTVVPAAVGDTDAAKSVPEKTHPSRRKWLVVGSVILLIVATAGGFWSYTSYRQQQGDFNKFSVPVEGPFPKAGMVSVNPKDGLKYVWIPPGTFVMGCSKGDNECQDDEKPPHQVTITKGFWMGQTEVAVGAFKRFAAATGRQMPPESGALNPGWGNEAMPIMNVTWDDAKAYCTWAGGRLPTEAEWEYAARAGSTEAHYGPLDEVAWDADNSGRKIHVVGQKRANAFGLFDMLGNVWEWVNDRHDNDYYKKSPSQDPTGPESNRGTEMRGGSWMDDKWCLRVSRRYSFAPDYKDIFLGFRCGGEVFAP